MLWIQTEEGKIGLSWEHDVERGRCTCTVANEAEDPLGFGLALCSKHDQYKKETGRKVSLTKALQDSEFGYDLRKQVWEGYRARCEARR